MIGKFIAILIAVGATYALPAEHGYELDLPTEAEKVPLTVGNSPSENVPLPPDNAALTPEDVPLSAENVPFTPDGNIPLEAERELLTENGPLPAGVTDEEASKEGQKPEESDLKTDATFWWPSFFRSYYRYPSYRYYRPRVYYRYYYW